MAYLLEVKSTWTHLQAEAAGGESELGGAVRAGAGQGLERAHSQHLGFARHAHPLHAGAPHRHQLAAVVQPLALHPAQRLFSTGFLAAPCGEYLEVLDKTETSYVIHTASLSS